MEAEMFEDPHMIHIKAEQKQKELLDELEMLRKIKSSSEVVPVENGWLGRMMLVIADLFIAFGVALRRRWMPVSERDSDIASDDAAP